MSATGLASACETVEVAAGRGEVAGVEAMEHVSVELQRAAAALRVAASVTPGAEQPAG